MLSFEKEFIDELNDFASDAPKFVPQQLTNPNNKWLVRSAFQKAMRRGQTDDALRYGQYLFTCDEKYGSSYAWSVLETVIIEDIGPLWHADLISYACMLTLKSVRDHIDEYKVFAAMVTVACSIPKSRICCELELGANMREQLGETNYALSLAELPPEQLMNRMLVTSFDLIDLERAYHSARYLRKFYRNKGPEAIIPALEFIGEQLPTDAYRRAAMLAFERGHDTMALTVFPLLRVFWGTLEITQEKEAWPESIRILTVGSEAFDMHVLQGKRAIKALHTHLSKDHEWVAAIDKQKAVKALGSLVFIEEGGLLDKRIMSANLGMLKKYQDYWFARGYGLQLKEHWADFVPSLDLIREKIPVLNQKRIWSVDL